MKKLLFYFFVLFTVMMKAQVNLVPNPSFEQYTGCPDYWDQINYTLDWTAYKGSPDYYNICGAVDSFSVPQNFIGYQLPASGSAYCGVILYDKANFGNDELIGANLTAPLLIGTKYFVSFKSVLKYNNPFDICCGQNKMGVKFSTMSYNISSPPIQNNFAHVYSSAVISDTSNWTQVFGSFVSDSMYTNVMLGNFFDNASTTINDIQPANNSSYYFIDDICVSTDSLYALNYIYTDVPEIESSKIFIYPNPTSEFIKISSEKFKDAFSVKIYNTLGQEVYSVNSNNNEPIDISKFNNSILLIKVIYNNQEYFSKIIKTEKP
ncbi:MAG: T9SS type A sorting domain-containing protein [Bacteroidetes bacterium]|nr:T9SS type A sorting domain-containing protein [Bacteroidota bacterium]